MLFYCELQLGLLEMSQLRIDHMKYSHCVIFVQEKLGDIFRIISPFQIASVIDSHAASLTRRADRDVFFMTMQGIVQLVQRYRNSGRS